MAKKTAEKKAPSKKEDAKQNLNGQEDSNTSPVDDVDFIVNAQYIKDMSIENPNPIKAMILGLEKEPQVDVAIHVNTETVTDESYEVQLMIQAKGRHDKDIIFLAELTYAGLFTIRNAPMELMHPLLLIECPRLLFPFARSIIAEMTRESNLPPLILKPVDFAALYRERMQQMAEESQGSA